MAIGGNILLITENEDTVQQVQEKLVLLRKTDAVSIGAYANIEQAMSLPDFNVVLLDEYPQNEDYTLNALKYIKNSQNSPEVILLMNEPTQSLVLKSYDLGLFDYASINCEAYELMIRVINAQKNYQMKTNLKIRNIMLENSEAFSEYKSFFEYTVLKNSFSDLVKKCYYKDSLFVILKLNQLSNEAETELAQAIIKSIRTNDIVATSNKGYFYLMLPQTELENAGALLEKIQQNCSSSKFYFGVTRITAKNFEEVENNALTALEKNIQNYDENSDITEFLESTLPKSKSKRFKLFDKKCSEKIQKIIAPMFSRYYRKCEHELNSDIKISKYVSDEESTFCLITPELKSELKIIQDGAKFKIVINHSGLDSLENSLYYVPMNKFSENDLDTLLKKLRNEFEEVAL